MLLLFGVGDRAYSVFTKSKLDQVNLLLVWTQFHVFSKLLKFELRVVAREEHTVLGKNRMASGREEAFKACAVSFGSNRDGSALLAVFLRSRHSCSDSLSALPTSV